MTGGKRNLRENWRGMKEGIVADWTKLAGATSRIETSEVGHVLRSIFDSNPSTEDDEIRTCSAVATYLKKTFLNIVYIELKS
jgi:hypothetical protein